MLVRIEGLAVAIVCLGLGWVVFHIFRLIGRTPRWVGRGVVSFRRDDDPRSDETSTVFGIGHGIGVDGGPPQGPGGASGGF